MNKNTIVAFAAAASAFANASLAFAQEMSGEVSTGAVQPTKAPETEVEEPKTSTRGKRGGAAKEEEPTITFEEVKAKTNELVKDGQGVAVKAAIAKYTDGKLADMDAKHYPAYLKDIEALSI